MSDVGSAITEVRAELAASAAEFFPRTCSLIPQKTVDDGFSGHRLADDTPINNVPCKVEARSGGYQVNESGSVVTKTHQITLLVTSDTVGIKKSHKIAVAAEGLTPAMTFDQLVVTLGDLDPFLTIYASFAEGYRPNVIT
jgi:hypothetical protein